MHRRSVVALATACACAIAALAAYRAATPAAPLVGVTFAAVPRGPVAPRASPPPRQRTLATVVEEINARGRFSRNATFSLSADAALLTRDWVGPRAMGRERPCVLLLGDSLDRFFTSAFCRELNNMRVWAGAAGLHYYTNWDMHYSRARGGNHADDDMGSFMCDGPVGSLAFLHLFGATARGPYAGNDRFTNIDGEAAGCNATAPPPDGVTCALVADTSQRLSIGLREHARITRAPPTLVVYQSLLWDAFVMTRNFSALPLGEGAAALMDAYPRNVAANLRWLRGALPSGTGIVVRTTPVGGLRDPPHATTALLNGVLRRVAAAEGVPLLDLDALLAEHPRSVILRDETHLNNDFSLAVARLIFRIARVAS